MKAHISHLGHFHINCLWRHHHVGTAGAGHFRGNPGSRVACLIRWKSISGSTGGRHWQLDCCQWCLHVITVCWTWYSDSTDHPHFCRYQVPYHLSSSALYFSTCDHICWPSWLTYHVCGRSIGFWMAPRICAAKLRAGHLRWADHAFW